MNLFGLEKSVVNINMGHLKLKKMYLLSITRPHFALVYLSFVY